MVKFLIVEKYILKKICLFGSYLVIVYLNGVDEKICGGLELIKN